MVQLASLQYQLNHPAIKRQPVPLKKGNNNNSHSSRILKIRALVWSHAISCHTVLEKINLSFWKKKFRGRGSTKSHGLWIALIVILLTIKYGAWGSCVSDARTPGTRLIDTWNDLSQCITDGATDKWRKTWGMCGWKGGRFKHFL